MEDNGDGTYGLCFAPTEAGPFELVVSLEARGGQTQVEFAGGLQEKKARDEICRVMEGGSEAFETRYRRIMLHGQRKDG